MSWEYISSWIEVHPGLAYWVQAIGSIGAIIGAFSVSAIQLRNQEKIRRLEARQKVEAFYAVIKNAVEYSVGVGEFVNKSPPDFAFRMAWAMHLGSVIQTALDGIRGIPAYELGTYERVLHYGTIVGSISRLQYEAEKYVSTEPDLDSERTFAAYDSIKLQSDLVMHGWSEFQKYLQPQSLSRKKNK